MENIERKTSFFKAKFVSKITELGEYSFSQPLNVVILGAGFGGLCMAIQLKEAGINNFIILEKSDNVGGTWYFNNYPGCACDVQSHLYSYSFEGKTDWTKRYGSSSEIQKYIVDLTEKYQLRKNIIFNHEVISAQFEEENALWDIKTKNNLKLQAYHLVVASGPLHVPNIPNIKGIENFKGRIFHSSNWDHNYSLIGKRVASIGTGGSAIQYLPEIAPLVSQLDVYQRSPAWVIPRDERKYSLFTKNIFKKFPSIRKVYRNRLYWSNELRLIPIVQPLTAKISGKFVKQFIKIQVKDKELIKKLTPNYLLGCKRILISNRYYPTFNKGNVALITDQIKEISNYSIITVDGKERFVDCIILGTGFIVDPRIYMKDFICKGLNNKSLIEDWANSAEAYYGVSVAGYPNMWQIIGPNSGLGHNSIIFMIEAQCKYIIQAMKLLKKKNADYMHVKKNTQTNFNIRLQEKINKTVWNSGCSSWYQQENGKNVALWPYSTWRYWLETRRVNSKDYIFGYSSNSNRYC
ncbi:flavin-containing monooxygenase [Acinetobacter lactucae]|uniref:flavin-containing monooxygenase n=1 Tax=Acinetobacter lactucae TaxID=1785128 RepID=UPI00358DAA56